VQLSLVTAPSPPVFPGAAETDDYKSADSELLLVLVQAGGGLRRALPGDASVPGSPCHGAGLLHLARARRA
jgi:hypothetical protein